jgi:glyoxylase-like metal-dependent hydrolase (beta-lactamase superfamily II)
VAWRHAIRVIALGLAVVVPASRSPAVPATSRSSPTPATRIDYEGTLLFEGDYRRPGQLHVFHSRQTYLTDGHDRSRLDWTTWQEGDTLLLPETYLMVGDSVFHRDAPGRPWRRFAGRARQQARVTGCAGLPSPLQRVARALDDSLVEMLVVGGRLVRYTRLQGHPRLGDVRDSVTFSYRGGDPVPDSMSVAVYWRDENWRLVQHRLAWSSETVADSMFAAPDSAGPAPAHEMYDAVDGMLTASPALVQIAAGIWSADMEDIGSRTLIVEFADHLAVIEVALGSVNGERIADAARRRWPDKPIRYLLFSHHHPHYVGGIRAMVAEGATVITTPGNEELVRNLASRPFHTRPDRLAVHPLPLHVVTFVDRYELSDSTNRLVAINYGERSKHTDEFVVFWLPRQKVLFEASLGWVRVNGALRVSGGVKPLLAWLDEQKMDVDRVVQSWPMRDNEAVVTRARLDSLVQARH